MQNKMEQGGEKPPQDENILEIRDLCVDFILPNGILRAVDHLNFNLPARRITGLVGESGSGKTTLTSALLRTVSNPGKISCGQVIYKGVDILRLSEKEIADFKWRDIAMVFQAAQNCLNPSMTIEEQFIETYMAHRKDLPKKDIIERSSKLLRGVRLDADRVLKAYPHELSGGMKQRVMIAFAQILEPPILLLDEPTTALDVITQDYIFSILQAIQEEYQMTMLLSTHDIAVVAKTCDNMAVMYAGKIVEMGGIYEMFENPKHPYTKLLIHAAPSLVGDLKEREAIPGGPPNLMEEHEGCLFAPRCPMATEECRQRKPVQIEISSGHFVSCHKVTKD